MQDTLEHPKVAHLTTGDRSMRAWGHTAIRPIVDGVGVCQRHGTARAIFPSLARTLLCNAADKSPRGRECLVRGAAAFDQATATVERGSDLLVGAAYKYTESTTYISNTTGFGGVRLPFICFRAKISSAIGIPAAEPVVFTLQLNALPKRTKRPERIVWGIRQWPFRAVDATIDSRE
jgi:hypothetical protein